MKKNERLALEGLQPGMVVAEAVLDAGGHVLLPVGSELSESILAGLERRSIESVVVEVVVEEDASALEARKQKLAAELDHRFRKAGEGEETRALYQSILNFSLEHQS